MKNGLYGENTCDSCNDGFGIATEVDSAYVKRFDQNMFAFDLSINFNERQNGLKTEKGGMHGMQVRTCNIDDGGGP